MYEFEFPISWRKYGKDVVIYHPSILYCPVTCRFCTFDDCPAFCFYEPYAFELVGYDPKQVKEEKAVGGRIKKGKALKRAYICYHACSFTGTVIAVSARVVDVQGEEWVYVGKKGATPIGEFEEELKRAIEGAIKERIFLPPIYKR